MSNQPISNDQSFIQINWRKWLRSAIAIVLAAVLILSPASSVWARTGGRAGGGSFSRPRMSAPRRAPSSSRGGYGGGGYYGGYGGGLGFPLLFPMFLGGGSGIFTLLIFMGVGSFVIRALRSARDESQAQASANPKVEVAELQVALLANARSLQNEVDRLARNCDPNSPSGLSKLLQEVTLSLVRHDEYWVYGNSSSETTRLNRAEQKFNRLSLQERSKFSLETLVNTDSLTSSAPLLEENKAEDRVDDLLSESGEYIVVTLLVAYEGSTSTLPVVDSSESLRRCLMQLGAVPAEQLIAMEVLWTPQATGDTLSAIDLQTEYPQLRLL
ncbi:MAG: DUF1517 domain-containing protein [Synechococcus sp.]